MGSGGFGGGGGGDFGDSAVQTAWCDCVAVRGGGVHCGSGDYVLPGDSISRGCGGDGSLHVRGFPSSSPLPRPCPHTWAACGGRDGCLRLRQLEFVSD